MNSTKEVCTMNRNILIGGLGILAIIIAEFTGTSFAREKTDEKGGSAGEKSGFYAPAKTERVNAFMVEKIVGSKVRNMKGEDLGTIQDIVVDIDTGRILYAVMDFGGFLGVGGKLFPVPWQSLAPLPSEGIFFLDISKEKLKNATGYDKDSLPDMGDMHWGTEVADFYGASREGRTYGYYGGLGLYPGIARQDPFAEVYNPRSIKKISGEVIKVDLEMPEKGIMSQMQIKLIVLVDGKEPVPVYIGPQWYVAGPDRRSPYKSGDKVTVTGSWITSQTEPFMIATAVTEGDHTFQLRQQDGTPIWSGLKTPEKG